MQCLWWQCLHKYFIDVNIINRKLHGHLEIQSFTSCVCSLLKNFSTLEEKFLISAPCNILYLSKGETDGNLFITLPLLFYVVGHFIELFLFLLLREILWFWTCEYLWWRLLTTHELLIQWLSIFSSRCTSKPLGCPGKTFRWKMRWCGKKAWSGGCRSLQVIPWTAGKFGC